MSPQDFLANFHEIANAPGGVARLREVVLHLAINGSLIDPISTKETGAALLSDVRRQCLEAGSKDYGVVGRDEEPFPLPSHWCWVRMGNLALSSDSGWSPQCESTPRRGSQWGVLKVSAVSWGKFAPEENKALPSGMAPRTECEVKVGDFLLSRANTEDLVAKSVVVESTPPHLMMSDKIVRFTFSDKVDKRFINLAHSSAHVRAHYAHNASGTSSSMKNVGRNVMCIAPIPLPPLAEQKRIVAKVDELMALCDALEAQQQERDRLFPRLSHATHTRLTDSPSQPHLDSLFTDLGSVSTEDMRKAILEMVVTGAFSSSTQVRVVKLGDVITLISGQHLLADEQNDQLKGIPYITGPADFGPISPEPKRWTETPKAIAEPGDIVITVKGAGVGKTNLVVKEPLAISRQLMAVRISDPDVNAEFIHLVLKNAAAHFQSLMTGIAIPGIGRRDVLELQTSLPPHSEQRRIVAKVDGVMALVDNLEARQQEKSRLAEAFAKACVSAITGTRIETEQKMKAPATELISCIRAGKTPPSDGSAPLADLVAQGGGELQAKTLWLQSGLEIDAFYQQLKVELAGGWIIPQPAEVRVVEEKAPASNDEKKVVFVTKKPKRKLG